MKYLLYAVTILYALLSILAAGTQFKTADRKDAPVLMILGSILLLLTVAVEIMVLFDGWPIAILGGALICTAALLNGRRSGNFHLKHHVIRLGITLLLILGYYML